MRPAPVVGPAAERAITARTFDDVKTKLDRIRRLVDIEGAEPALQGRFHYTIGPYSDPVLTIRPGDRVLVDSAGTHSYHVGAPPDARSQAHAAQRGYDLSTQRARQLTAGDFEDFDLILAMDWDNLALAGERCPPQHAHKLRRFAEFFQHHNSPVVPDPYQGGARGFEEVLDLVEDGCEGLMQHVRRSLAGAN